MKAAAHHSLASLTGIALFLGALVGVSSALATPSAVTGVTYGTESNGTNVDVNNIIYDNRSQTVSTISTATENYVFDGPAASNVYFRRGSTGSNGATAWYQGTDFDSGSGGYTVYGQGDSSPTLSELMLTSNLSEGLRNPFANTVSSSSIGPTSNIERIDFYFGSGGYTVKDGAALVFFDLENFGNHGDGFRIAAFNGWNTSTNVVTSYVNTGLLVAPGSYGDGLDVPGSQNNIGYIRSTTTNGDNLSGTQSVTTIDSDVSGSLGSSDLTIVGILISFADLGLNVGDVIYGYSLMAGDVVASNASQLIDYTNTSVYLNTTNAGSNPDADYGNVDFAAFGAKISRPVPEPATYGAVFLAGITTLFAWRRRPARTA
ncbi:MAG TPA: PEP-CTERM sorting domain-containing protein [Rariglobus sp.]